MDFTSSFSHLSFFLVLAYRQRIWIIEKRDGVWPKCVEASTHSPLSSMWNGTWALVELMTKLPLSWWGMRESGCSPRLTGDLQPPPGPAGEHPPPSPRLPHCASSSTSYNTSSKQYTLATCVHLLWGKRWGRAAHPWPKLGTLFNAGLESAKIQWQFQMQVGKKYWKRSISRWNWCSLCDYGIEGTCSGL